VLLARRRLGRPPVQLLGQLPELLGLLLLLPGRLAELVALGLVGRPLRLLLFRGRLLLELLGLGLGLGGLALGDHLAALAGAGLDLLDLGQRLALLVAEGDEVLLDPPL